MQPVGAGHWQDGVQTGNASAKYFTYTRAPLASFPLPSFPALRNPLGNGPLWKFATSYALLRQLFK